MRSFQFYVYICWPPREPWQVLPGQEVPLAHVYKDLTSSLIWISPTLTELLTRSLCLTWESQISPAPISILSDAIAVRFGTLRLCRHPNFRLDLVLYICICTASFGYIPFSTLVLRAHGPDNIRFLYSNSRRLVSVRNKIG